MYLHHACDLWIEAWRQKVATGDVIVVRYADDLVVGFENRTEAERFLEAFRERFANFGLGLNPEKTRLIEFGRFAAPEREKRGEGKLETFTFLGFTHHCGKRWSNGAFTVWRKTAKKRMAAKLHALKAELRRRMHEPLADVGAWLRKVVTVITATTRSRETSTGCVSSGNACGDCGGSFYDGAVNAACRGIG